MPTLPQSLPLLSESELIDRFGNDQAVLRRYQLLHAVLVMGMTQRDAADANGVSERTVRNVLRSYNSLGLDALHSRHATRRRRRDRRMDSAEQALAGALAEEPQAGGDRLWRRAQELLNDTGLELSRRTAYRILTRLRAESDDDDEVPNSLRAVVRAALPLLPEDPPLALGASPLAQRLLPNESEALLRGTLLQQALRAALDGLRPPGAVSAIDRNWWPYLICTGEYETGQRRAELQDDLALSPSTYSRAKRQGLDHITTMLPQIIERMIEAPAALTRQRLPRTPDFIGRHEEQSYYAWRLQAEGLAHIWGLPGSGKTALAAELAAEGHRYGQTILWHTCRAGPESTLIGIVRGLAKALAGAGDDELWQQFRRAPIDEQDPPALLDMLRERLMARPAVVVLDDIHRVDLAETETLFDALADLVARRSTRLLLVGRTRMEATKYPPLQGLSEREAQLLWVGAPPLSAEQWSALYQATAGLPQPLKRAAAAYRRAGDLARPGDWIDEITAWVGEEIWSRLSPDEQRLVMVAHALETRPWAEQMARVCETLGIAPETHAQLQRRGLLGVSGAAVLTIGALRFTVETRLREDGEARKQLEALEAALNTSEPAALDTPANQGILDSEDERTPAAPPAGLELINRVREALQTSAAYMQDQHADQLARELVVELEALQAALPDPAGPRTPLVRTLGS